MWSELKHLLGFCDPPPLIPAEPPEIPASDPEIDQRKGDLRQALTLQQAQHRTLQRLTRKNRSESSEARQTLAGLRSSLKETMSPPPRPHDMLASMLDQMKPREDGDIK